MEWDRLKGRRVRSFVSLTFHIQSFDSRLYRRPFPQEGLIEMDWKIEISDFSNKLCHEMCQIGGRENVDLDLIYSSLKHVSAHTNSSIRIRELWRNVVFKWERTAWKIPKRGRLSEVTRKDESLSVKDSTTYRTLDPSKHCARVDVDWGWRDDPDLEWDEEMERNRGAFRPTVITCSLESSAKGEGNDKGMTNSRPVETVNYTHCPLA